MSKPRAFTLVEVMITLIIVATLLSLGLATMSGYLPKQRLIASVSNLENLLQRAQSEATSRAYWSCVEIQTGVSTRVELFMDTNSNRVCDDTKITDFQLKDNVQLAGGSTCGSDNPTMGSKVTVWFDTTGIPNKCEDNSGTITCTPNDFQIVLSNVKLDSGTKAREVEATRGGLISSVKPGTKGLLTGRWAKYSAGDTTTGACE